MSSLPPSPSFQAALLYTNIFGQRRLRIHNLALNCSSKFADLYRSCEVDTIMNFLSKSGQLSSDIDVCYVISLLFSVTKAAFNMLYKSIRDNFTHQIAVILACYRKQCSSQSPPGQVSVIQGQAHTHTHTHTHAHTIIALYPTAHITRKSQIDADVC